MTPNAPTSANTPAASNPPREPGALAEPGAPLAPSSPPAPCTQAAPGALPGEPAAAAVWVLLGARHGDNRQLLAIATALRRPYRAIPLRFNAAAGLPPVVVGARRLSWHSAALLAPPWPRVVLAAGRKSVAAARWIQRQSKGSTRLVHVNRPWAPLAWFDLIVTTPQYGLPARPNVVANVMPFQPPPISPSPLLPPALQPVAAALPRPWTGVLVGGDSRPYVLDTDAVRRLARQIDASVRDAGGSAWVIGSPRTPAAALTVLQQALGVPHHVVRWGVGENPYDALLGLADRFIVTADSASMLAEALASGRPVWPFALPARPDWRWRVAGAWRAAAERAPRSLAGRSFEAVLDLGLLSSVRDVARLQGALQEAGAFGAAGRAPEIAEREQRRTLARIDALIEGR